MLKVIAKIFGAGIVVIGGVLATLMGAESMTGNLAVVWDKITMMFTKADDDDDEDDTVDTEE